MIEKRVITTEICRDQGVILSILENDYYDVPVRFFPHSLKRMASHWIAREPRLLLLRAEVDGKYAGFVFGHDWQFIWRRFALSHPNYLFHLLLVAFRAKIMEKIRKKFFKEAASPEGKTAEIIGKMNIPNQDRDFSWSPPEARAGRVELIFVREDCRGLGIAIHLLERIREAMGLIGALSIEAHIDSGNIASLIAFRKAGYSIFRMKKGDYYVSRAVPGPR